MCNSINKKIFSLRQITKQVWAIGDIFYSHSFCAWQNARGLTIVTQYSFQWPSGRRPVFFLSHITFCHSHWNILLFFIWSSKRSSSFAFSMKFVWTFPTKVNAFSDFITVLVTTFIWLFSYSFTTKFYGVNLTECQSILSILRRYWLGEFGPLYEITRSLLVLTAHDLGARKKCTKKYQFLDKKTSKNAYNKSENPVRDKIILRVLNIYKILPVVELRRRIDGFNAIINDMLSSTLNVCFLAPLCGIRPAAGSFFLALLGLVFLKVNIEEEKSESYNARIHSKNTDRWIS